MINHALIDAELAIIRRLARAITQGDPASRDYYTTRLADLEAARKHTMRTLTVATDRVEQAAIEAILQAVDDGSTTAVTELQHAMRPKPLPPALRETIIAAQTQTVSLLLQASALEAGRAAHQWATRTLTDITTRVALGATDRREEAARIVAQAARRGVTAITDRAGRRWDMGAYAEMVTRTHAMRALTEGHRRTLVQNNIRYGVVQGHGYSCPLCSPWEGKILSLEGDAAAGPTPVPSMVDDTWVTVPVAGSLAQAEAAGLHHPNCAHTVSAYIPGATRPEHVHTSEGTPEGGYAATQAQRSAERDMRAADREMAAATTPVARAIAKRHHDAARRRLESILAEYTDLRRKPGREDGRALSR